MYRIFTVRSILPALPLKDPRVLAKRDQTKITRVDVFRVLVSDWMTEKSGAVAKLSANILLFSLAISCLASREEQHKTGFSKIWIFYPPA